MAGEHELRPSGNYKYVAGVIALAQRSDVFNMGLVGNEQFLWGVPAGSGWRANGYQNFHHGDAASPFACLPGAGGAAQAWCWS